LLSTKKKEEEENASTNIKDVDGEMIYQYCKDRFEAKTLTISTLTSRHNNSNNNDTNPKSKWTFRVSCERIGIGHQFRAPDVEREIGGAISEYYSNSCIPAMEDYDIHIRTDVIGSIIVIGTQLNVHDLSKERHFLRYRNAVTLKVISQALFFRFCIIAQLTHTDH
jgi:adenylyl- and sulfurtransferase ThiI